MHRSYLKTLAAVILASGALAVSASAAIITFDLGINVNGGPSPVGPTPWLTATFADGSHNSVDGVFLTLDAANLTGSEKVQNWYFNLNPSLDPNSLAFEQTAMTGTFSNPSFATGNNNQNSPGGPNFDIKVGFATSTANAFTAGDSVTIFISGIAGLDAADFDYLSGDYASAAHVLSVGPGAGSVTIGATPEPSHAIFGALLLGGLLWVERGRLRSLFRKEGNSAS